LDKHLHYYGDHFKYPHEIYRNKNQFRNYVKYLFALYKIIQNSKLPVQENIILSSAYFSVDQELKKIGYQVFCPSWQMSQDRNVLSSFDILSKSEKIKTKFRDSNFREFIKEDFINEIAEFENALKIFFQRRKIKALVVANDMSFFENISIQVCKQIGIPTFIFLHGLPGRYNSIDDNRSNYLFVWGEKIKDNYVKSGMDANKIFVSGHPYYQQLKSTQLKFSFENILIVTKSLNGAHHSDGVILGDRANLILYLYSIEKILKKLGVKSVRFRPHPSENGTWYLKYINIDFFKLDNANLEYSIQSSSLVIGPTSTVLLESLYHGVNYVVYEPSLSNIDVLNFPLVSPFDGNDPKIPVSKDEMELEYILKTKKMIDSTCFNDYISTPFNLSVINELI
jgi:hypothetical protein